MPVAGRACISEPGKISTRQLLRTLNRKIGHQRHAIIFEVAEAQRTWLIGVMGRHGVEQILPVRSERRRTFAAHRRQILLSRLVVRHRQHTAIGRQPFHLAGAVDGIALLGPARRIGTAEPMQGVLHDVERQVGAGYFDGKNDKVDVIEKIQIDMPDVEHDRHVPPGEGDPRLCHVGPAIDLYRGFAVGGHRAALGAFAVEKPLHKGQERHELAVMPFLEGIGIGAEFVIHFLPDTAGVLLEQLPMLMDLRTFLQRQ